MRLLFLSLFFQPCQPFGDQPLLPDPVLER